MKDIISLLSFLIISLSIFSQTEEIELKRLSERFANKEFDQVQYAEMGQNFRDIIKFYGSFPLLPYNELTKEIEFTKVESFTGIDKKVIYDRILEWSAIKFGSLNSVIKYSNLDDGKIILKGWFDIVYSYDAETFFMGKKEGVNNSKCSFTYVFTIKDNKLKIEVLDIRYEGSYYVTAFGTSFLSEHTVDRSIHSLYPITDSKLIEWKGRLDILNQTNIKILSFFNSIEGYINNKSSDYSF